MHCTYCFDQPSLRGAVHCRDCGLSDRPVDPTTSVCTACEAWAAGDRPMPDLEAASLLFAAIVERSLYDKNSVRYHAAAHTPTYCDTPGCDMWTFACGSRFHDIVKSYAESVEGDPIAVMLMVAGIAVDSAPETRAA